MPKRKFIPTNALEALGEACGHSRKSLRRAVGQPITDDDAYLMRKVKARIEPSESKSQQTVVSWWNRAAAGFGLHYMLLFSIPNQGQRSYKNASRMKAEGLRSGIPDLQLTVPRKGFHGMFLEMKKKGNKPTENQLTAKSKLQEQGYFCVVCFTADDAILCITDYLANRP